jgi:hypothetical protein
MVAAVLGDMKAFQRKKSTTYNIREKGTGERGDGKFYAHVDIYFK